MFIHSPIGVGTLLMGVPGTPIASSFFNFELKSKWKESVDTISAPYSTSQENERSLSVKRP